MKKALIILAVILTSGLTALSVSKSENKSQPQKITIEKNLGVNTDNLGTAD